VRLIRENRPLIIAAVLAAIAVTVVAIVTESMAAVLLTGLVAGVMTGGFLTMQQKPKAKKKRKR